MSELKVRFIDDTYVEYYNTGKHDLAQVYLKSEADETIAELKAENQRLKKCEIWMMQHFYCEEVIACESAKNRKLKRALWLARARTAHLEVKCFVHDMYDDDATAEESAKDEIMANKWYKVKLLCIKKAKEYK